MIEYKIYPSIGIARVGNAPEKFYIGPETYRGLPINPDGREFVETDFRDGSGRLCRQAARFRIYRRDGGTLEEITLKTPGVGSIAWTAHLANKKRAGTSSRPRSAKTAMPPTTRCAMPERPIVAN